MPTAVEGVIQQILKNNGLLLGQMIAKLQADL